MPSWRNVTWCNHKVAEAAPAPAPVPVQEEEEDDSYAYPCGQCDKGFTSQRGLSRHTTEKHPVEDPALD